MCSLLNKICYKVINLLVIIDISGVLFVIVKFQNMTFLEARTIISNQFDGRLCFSIDNTACIYFHFLTLLFQSEDYKTGPLLNTNQVMPGLFYVCIK